MEDQIDTAAAWDEIRRLPASGVPVSEAMARVIGVCEWRVEHPGWDELRQLDWEADVALLESWVRRSVGEWDDPSGIRGLYFGLCQPGLPETSPAAHPIDTSDGRRYTTLDLELYGTRRYDPTEVGSPQWVFSSAGGWCEARDYANLNCIHEIFRIDDSQGILTGNPLPPMAIWALGLGFVTAGVPAALAEFDSATITDEVEQIGIAAGWGEGDYFRIGELTRGGFRAKPL